MIVYHGSLLKVEQPRLLVPSHTLDYAAFALYEQGFIDKQALIREMRAYKFVDQLLFHTEKAIKTLIYIESMEVKI